MPTCSEDLVRVGKEGDGGYVLPKHLIKVADTLVSMGVFNDWSFEKDFLKLNPNIKIHAYDHSISRSYFRNSILIGIAKFLLAKTCLSNVLFRINVYREYKKFFPQRAVHFQEMIFNRMDNNKCATIDTVIKRTCGEKIFIKMDIECCEYRVLEDVLRYSSNVIGIVIEFHDTEPYRLTFNNIVQKLLEKYHIAHIHANNYSGIGKDNLPEVLEITFIRKDLVTGTKRRSKFPILGLDYPNVADRPDIQFQFQDHQTATTTESTRITTV